MTAQDPLRRRRSPNCTPGGELPWDALTVLPEKKSAFGKDLYFREAWQDVENGLGESAAEILGATALLSVKPDAVVGRRLARIVDFCVGRGFLPVASATTRFNRHSMRALWEHDWHVYPVDRLAFCSYWYPSADILVLLLVDQTVDRNLPASVRLTGLKGSSLAHKRTGDSLRSQLAPPNQVLNFVHVADEPVDVVRELGILFDRTQRRAMVDALAHPPVPTALQETTDRRLRLEEEHPAHDLDFAASLDRLRGAGLISPEHAARLAKSAVAGEPVAWDRIRADMDIDALDPSARWDFITVASKLIDLERPVASLFRTDEIASGWHNMASEPRKTALA
ncbi:MAG: hypothetical protein NXI16_04080 [Alphaproteobacteria bacterium]|nr:hypothetical protein [Alphaproteobacteria bacterium]